MSVRRLTYAQKSALLQIVRQGFPYSALACLDRLIEHERNQQ